MHLEYPDRDASSRFALWRNFFAISKRKVEINEDDMRILAEGAVDGRQMKSIIKQAQVLAARPKSDSLRLDSGVHGRADGRLTWLPRQKPCTPARCQAGIHHGRTPPAVVITMAEGCPLTSRARLRVPYGPRAPWLASLLWRCCLRARLAARPGYGTPPSGIGADLALTSQEGKGEMPPKRNLRRARVERVESIERDVINNAELQANAQQLVAMLREQRPENTNQVYLPKQAEFKSRR
ncbi:hypothetical protein BU23DRAFT_115896 [Bimuria novae-zelandiae CBS 107.79]|uniref:Uncharacterized protein n=1 Tax=Bimuria novae-zelandiae CBS 107.79 TaxID=1447943 RepID=A0A6A5VLT6_9PLEO|nr:hypothetical protein BU23DRAFT_115896 [Bimuria novae-zelandiae CBS 107.79]